MTHLGTCFEIFLRAAEGHADREGILDDDYLLVPPNPDYGYWCTPSNAITFAVLGCDGVHYAILEIDGQASTSRAVAAYRRRIWRTFSNKNDDATDISSLT